MITEKMKKLAGVRLDESREIRGKFDQRKIENLMKKTKDGLELSTDNPYVTWAYIYKDDFHEDTVDNRSVLAVDQDGEEHEIDLQDIISVTVH